MKILKFIIVNQLKKINVIWYSTFIYHGHKTGDHIIMETFITPKFMIQVLLSASIRFCRC